MPARVREEEVSHFTGGCLESVAKEENTQRPTSWGEGKGVESRTDTEKEPTITDSGRQRLHTKVEKQKGIALWYRDTRNPKSTVNVVSICGGNAQGCAISPTMPREGLNTSWRLEVPQMQNACLGAVPPIHHCWECTGRCSLRKQREEM